MARRRIPTGRPPGRPKGSKTQKTLEKEEARALLRRLVTAELEPLARAQIDNAKGISHFMLRDPKTGKFERILDHEQILAALNSGDPSSYYIYTKDPSIQAFTDLMNRALDKPVEQTSVDFKGPLTVKWEGE
jgi:hypothetical protein